jgi:hypothetical protein
MASLNVARSSKVGSKVFTSLRNPNWNWIMSVISPYEISQANYLNFDSYIIAKHDLWQKDPISWC